jgi:HD-GYP domain-containing protein (c-di-GMP phosphodiesterase class II)
MSNVADQAGARTQVRTQEEDPGAALFEAAIASIEAEPRFATYALAHPHPRLFAIRDEEHTFVLALADVWDHHRDVLRPYAERVANGEVAILLLGTPTHPDIQGALALGVTALLPERPTPADFVVAFATAKDLLATRNRAESRGKWLDRYRYELGELIEIARALTTEREIDKLLSLILEKARGITTADAGSIYVVEGDDPDIARRTLRFKLTQNDSLRFDSGEFTVPITARSISGNVALTKRIIRLDDVYDLPPGTDFTFDHRFDERIGYRTKSMLTAPLVTQQGEVIGVLQLINKKRDTKTRLTAPSQVAEDVIPFDDGSEQLVATLAAQAGIALENALLYAEIRELFEGFVNASVSAIEQRDPTTSGHSRRVADLTVGLAKAVERIGEGPYRDVTWAPKDLRELEYASLLHDFGKIGVREQVLVKAKKLYPGQLDGIRLRFDYVRRSMEVDMLRRKVKLLETGSGPGAIAALEETFEQKVKELEESWDAVSGANEPTVLRGGDFARVDALSRETYTDLCGHPRPLLEKDEVLSLSVTRGSLTAEEIDEIRSHVVHTESFFRNIPWGSAFRNVPLIAGAHHERLDGTGYPRRLRAEEIPLQSKLMSIADIFDALTASDRPYKKAIPIDRALDILSYEVKDNHLDGDLVTIFSRARPWESSTLR